MLNEDKTLINLTRFNQSPCMYNYSGMNVCISASLHWRVLS